MAKDVSIVFKASDNLSDSIRQMRKNVDGLSRDVTEYRKIQDKAFEKKTEIKFDISKAKQELKELDRAVKQNVEGAEKAFKDKQKALEQLNEEYRRLSQVAKDASKIERQLQDDLSKSSNKNATRQPSIMSSLAGAGLGNMIGGAVAGNLNQSVSSIFGSTTGSAISGVVGGAISGAALGSIAGPIGAAVGTAVGGLTGAINAMTAKQEKADDLFRAEVQGIFDLVKQEQSVGLANGIESSSTREQNIMGLGTLLGDRSKGIQMFEDIKQFGINTPYQASTMLDAAKQMLAYGVKEENIMSDMKMLGEVAMGNQNKFNSLSYAYAQTQSAGKLMGQDLMQYTSAGFNPLQVLADEQGKTLSEMRDKMSEGLVTAEDMTRAFQLVTQEGGKFFGSMSDQMDTYKGKLSMLTDIKAEIETGYGEGYNAKRQEGMEKELSYLNGELGENMKDANRLIGEYQAELENNYQQSIISSMSLAQRTNEYAEAEAKGDGAKMGEILAKARSEAEVNHRNGEGMLRQKQADLDLVQSIQEDTMLNSAYLDYGRKMGEAFSKGYAGAVHDVVKSGALTAAQETEVINKKGNVWQKTWRGITDSFSHAKENGIPTFNVPTGFATGLDRVPYNGMPAVLHEGERVLTKIDADKFDKGLTKGATNINITVNNNSGNAYEITKEICNNIMRASEIYAGGV